MSNTISWEYPEVLLDEDGYPTDEALDYIKNWGLQWRQMEEPTVGKYFGTEENYGHLVDYLKAIWWMAEDAIEYKDGLLELHTYGWSGNEDIIAQLKDTNLWLLKLRAQQSGGHYYFKIDSEAEEDWHIVKSKEK